MFNKEPQLIEGKDYYINEQGLYVFTADYHLRRGFCCGSGCLHCPYGFRKENDPDNPKPFIHSTDQTGNQLTIPFPPQRIISLVPSQTELLFDLGLDHEICGVTKFCVHPANKTKTREKIGGTKKFNMDRIHALQPDLIIGNKEENYQEGIQSLQQHYPVWMSDILTLSDACSMINGIATITDRAKEGQEMTDEILRRFSSYTPLPGNLSAAYFIWNEPFMVAASDTFINEMLSTFGVTNVFSHLSRYPEVSLEMVTESKPDLILLSSEPYPFNEKHANTFRELLPSSKVIIVDGQYFSWYGSRLLQTPEYFEKLKMNWI